MAARTSRALPVAQLAPVEYRQLVARSLVKRGYDIRDAFRVIHRRIKFVRYAKKHMMEPSKAAAVIVENEREKFHRAQTRAARKPGRDAGTMEAAVDWADASCPVAMWKTYKQREMGRLHMKKIRSSEDAAAVIAAVCGTQLTEFEHFVLIGLDRENKVVSIADGTSLHPARCKIVPSHMIAALYQGMSQTRDIVGVIIGHNHPSGDVQPSVQDVAFMKVFLCEAEFMPVMDHVVVGFDRSSHSLRSFSMREAYGERLFVGKKCRLDVDVSSIVQTAPQGRSRGTLRTLHARGRR